MLFQLMTMMSVIDLNAILECNKLRYRTNGFLVCYLILNYCNLISVTEIDLSLFIWHFLTKKSFQKISIEIQEVRANIKRCH